MAKGTFSIQFEAALVRPGGADRGATWCFLRLPAEASLALPSRGMVSVEGRINGSPFASTLQPDGEGGHWMKVNAALREAAGASVGDIVDLDISPASVEPEPEIPADLQEALDAAPPKALETWSAITPAARRDYVFWIVSGKKAETRVKRIEVAIDKLAKGNRRPCCFDRSGMYGRSLSCPLADETE